MCAVPRDAEGHHARSPRAGARSPCARLSRCRSRCDGASGRSKCARSIRAPATAPRIKVTWRRLLSGSAEPSGRKSGKTRIRIAPSVHLCLVIRLAVRPISPLDATFLTDTRATAHAGLGSYRRASNRQSQGAVGYRVRTHSDPEFTGRASGTSIAQHNRPTVALGPV